MTSLLKKYWWVLLAVALIFAIRSVLFGGGGISLFRPSLPSSPANSPERQVSNPSTEAGVPGLDINFKGIAGALGTRAIPIVGKSAKNWSWGDLLVTFVSIIVLFVLGKIVWGVGVNAIKSAAGNLSGLLTKSRIISVVMFLGIIAAGRYLLRNGIDSIRISDMVTVLGVVAFGFVLQRKSKITLLVNSFIGAAIGLLFEGALIIGALVLLGGNIAPSLAAKAPRILGFDLSVVANAFRGLGWLGLLVLAMVILSHMRSGNQDGGEWNNESF